MEEEQLARIERDEQAPDELTVQRLARSFGCTPAYLTADPAENPETVAVLARLSGALTESDRHEASRFATYLRHAVED
jgi:transcriptional regulator with XRE-family HTH domain